MIKILTQMFAHMAKYTGVVRRTLLNISSDAVIPAKAGIQIENTGFRVKPGMTIKVKGLLTQYTREYYLHSVKRRKRSRRVVDARSVISYFVVREMGRNGAELGRMLNMSRSGVSIAADRGEALVRDNPLLRSIAEGKSTI